MKLRVVLLFVAAAMLAAAATLILVTVLGDPMPPRVPSIELEPAALDRTL